MEAAQTPEEAEAEDEKMLREISDGRLAQQLQEAEQKDRYAEVARRAAAEDAAAAEAVAASHAAELQREEEDAKTPWDDSFYDPEAEALVEALAAEAAAAQSAPQVHPPPRSEGAQLQLQHTQDWVRFSKVVMNFVMLPEADQRRGVDSGAKNALERKIVHTIADVLGLPAKAHETNQQTGRLVLRRTRAPSQSNGAGSSRAHAASVRPMVTADPKDVATVMEVRGCSRDTAEEALDNANGSVDTAVMMLGRCE